MAEYPDREQYFAHKFTRLLLRCCIANEIGPEACYMLVQIAHTEDAAHYRKAVTFYNEQLVSVCGFNNVKALDRARKRAIDAGWLSYEAGGKSKAGKYHVLIPKYADGLPDNSMESDFHPGYLVEIDQANGNQTGIKRESNGNEVGGIRATIIPVPVPVPVPGACSALDEPTTEPPPVLTFPCNGKVKEWHLTQNHMTEWSEAYPDLDILAECKRALAWVNANKKKTATGMTRYLVNWLNRSTDQPNGHSRPLFPPEPRKTATPIPPPGAPRAGKYIDPEKVHKL